MDDIDSEYHGEIMQLEWSFDLYQFVYACLQLPVPLWVLYHINKQWRRARKIIQLEPDAPILLPIYTYLIYAEICYVVMRFVLYAFLYPHMDYGDRSGDAIVADSVFHAFMFMLLADGMAVFTLVLIFSFLISPTAGRNSLHSSLRKAIVHGGFYIALGVFCMTALSKDYLKAYYILQIVAPSTVVVFLVSKLVYMYSKRLSRWKGWLFASAWLTLFLWVLYTFGCVAKLSGAAIVYITGIRYFISFVYAFILPYVYYQALIQDSIYWRNLDKYLFPKEPCVPTEATEGGLSIPLIPNDGLGLISISQEKRHLDDTLSCFKVPLIDWMHLERATDLLGRGGYAVVWKAVYHGSTVAVKELLREKISVKHIKSFFREAVLSTKLSHPNILKFYGACVQPPEFLMIFEWCNGGDLGSYLVEEMGFLSNQTRLDMAMQACRALNFLHTQGMIHRDIKPANYLVHVDNRLVNVKLADFGSCRSMHDRLPLFEGVSPLFVAPEIRELIPQFFDDNGEPIRDKERPDMSYSLEVDVFSLGWVLWAIFKEGDYKKLLKAMSVDIFRGEWMPEMDPGDWDEELIDIIDCCWSVRADSRPTSEEVYDALFTIYQKRYETFHSHETLSLSKSSENISRTDSKPSTPWSEENVIQMAAREFSDGVRAFFREIHKVQEALEEKPSMTADGIYHVVEQLKVMALNATMSFENDQLVHVVQESTRFPYSICRMIMRFCHAFENDIEDFEITNVTSEFCKNLNYSPSQLLRRKCHVFQFEPHSEHRNHCTYDLSCFSQRERLVYEHNKKMFAPMAQEFDKASLWQRNVNLSFPGILQEGMDESSVKGVFPMYNFDGKGDIFIMLMVIFPYFDSSINKYASFSLQARLDFNRKLRKTEPERHLLQIYDSFLKKRSFFEGESFRANF